MDKTKYIWMDGKLVNWDDAKVHVLTHSLHYGLAAFEGIRCYEGHDGGLNAFRLTSHIRRLLDTCKIINCRLAYNKEEIISACKQLVNANDIGACYIRPLVYIGYGTMGVYPGDTPVSLAIACWKWGKYLGEGALEKGVKVKVSSFSRHSPTAVMTRGKITGSYATGVLAKVDAIQHGYDEALLLDQQGYVAEGSGENVFIVRDKVIKTTPLTVILPGVTRDSVITLARDLGYKVLEERFTKDEVYIADEVFFTGTACEITPITQVDGRVIGTGKRGPVTQSLQDLFFAVVSGREERYKEWLDPIEKKTTKKGKRLKSVRI